MKLQIALDDITLDAAVTLLEGVSPSIDIIETGTPLVLEYGMEAVRTMRRLWPDKEIFCDAKIMDGGTIEAASAFRAGADYVSVLAAADKSTITAVVEQARAQEKQAIADLLCVDDFEHEIPRLEALGVEMVAVHVGVDQQRSGRTPLQDLANIKALAKNIKVAVAGGISRETLPQYIKHGPDIVIVGSALCGAKNPLAEAAALRALMQGGL